MGGLSRGSPLKLSFPTVRAVGLSFAIMFAGATFLSSSHFLVSSQSLPRVVFFVLSGIVASQDFVSKTTLTEQQIGDELQLEPSSEHLLRDANVDNGTILALCRCQITDRETFVGLDDTVEGLKSLAKDILKLEICHTRGSSRGSPQPGKRPKLR